MQGPALCTWIICPRQPSAISPGRTATSHNRQLPILLMAWARHTSALRCGVDAYGHEQTAENRISVAVRRLAGSIRQWDWWAVGGTEGFETMNVSGTQAHLGLKLRARRRSCTCSRCTGQSLRQTPGIKLPRSTIQSFNHTQVSRTIVVRSCLGRSSTGTPQ